MLLVYEYIYVYQGVGTRARVVGVDIVMAAFCWCMYISSGTRAPVVVVDIVMAAC